MSDARDSADDSLRWVAYAREDLLAAATLLKANKGLTKQIGYHSQQAAEKAIKAALIFLQVKFPFVHDLDELRNRLPDQWKCVEDYPELDALTDFAVEGRYPGTLDEPAEEDAQKPFSRLAAYLLQSNKT
ncbi:MAG: HEPN domain-containing protein [Phormidesmis sp.]